MAVFLVFFLFSFLAYGQNAIQGTVVDRDNNPLPGATIMIKSTNTGTVSDEEGNFNLTIDQSLPVTLEVSFIGYTAQEIDVYDSGEPVIVTLAEERNILNEVVVIGYGTQSRREFTGSVASISGDLVKELPVQSFDQALQGKAAGVSIALPNGQLNAPAVIRIRGVNSISLSSYPLIVVDGIPLSTGDISTNRAANNPLGDINPADIASIDILKDAASTAIYGSKAAGGVILVTTKRGKAGHATTHYESWVGFTNATRLPNVLNAQQYTDIKNESIANATAIDGTQREPVYFLSYNPDGSIVDTNWRDYIYRTAVSHNHSLSVAGGSEKVNYYLSLNYSDQEGILVGNDFQRKGIRFNLDNRVTDWLKLTAGAVYNVSENKSYDTGSLPGASMTTTGAARLALVLPPNVGAYNDDGSYHLNPNSGTLGSGNNKTTIPLYNPAALFDLSRYTSQNDHVISNISASIRPVKQVELTTTYAIDRVKTENITFLSPELGSSGYNSGGSVTNVTITRQNQAWTNTLSFNETFLKDHHLSALLGTDIQYNELSAWGANATNASDDFFEYYQGGWANVVASGNRKGTRVFASLFSRLSYDLKGRYFLTGNFRRDGNSALAEGRKYGNFGGVSGGWLLSEESFFKSSPLARTFDNVKLNASWGQVGNGNLENDYSSYDLYSSYLYGSAATWSITQQGNPDLSWETSEQTNVGIEVSAFTNRLNAELTYFNNNVNGLILSVAQSPSKGIPGNSILANVGSMYNRGIEFGIGYEVIRRKDLTWNLNFNYTNLRNKVTSLADENQDIIASTGSGNTNITRVGEPIGSLYGLKTLYVNPENGQRVFLNGKGEEVQYNGLNRWTYLDGSTAEALSGDDFYVLGNALPKWYGGLASNLTYKDFELNLNFTYAGGNYVMNRTRSTLTDQIFFNNSTDILRRWTSPGQQTDIPRIINGDRISFGGSVPISEHVEKGDFLRLQNVVFAYNLPESALGFSRLSAVRVYGQVTNAFIITGYSGIDPEVSANGNSNTAPGVEYNTAGLGRTFTFGVNVTF
ncbi:SusC/RagA family [Proteiniphilum saccharofermentans]|uniref:SusC/RagA family n=1 Tax=Proteiniphilum saccharofermentans TaxID=1642647 RepID=A0A1R3T060_9BACT|nr:SusC/RagA family TonB-linked outer membrane protein [Proteiniphilum saccharofermentans]SCD21803.1 SusC/RagA family [Proteiniphilum saccharofermentans]